jgi:flagellar basal body-associated protein FliL
MKAIIILVVLLLVVAVIAVVASWVSRKLRQHAAHSRWKVAEIPRGNYVEVYLVHPTKQPLLVSTVPFFEGDFDFKIEEARSEANQRMVAMNSAKEIRQ